MFISQYSVEHWQGNQNQEEVRVATGWSDLESAIVQLDGKHHTLVTLETDQDAHMCVGGGPDRYLVYATLDNEAFPYLIDPNQSDSEETVVVGGQAGVYPAKLCVDLAMVLKAAQAFANLGQLEPSLAWTGDGFVGSTERLAEPVAM